MFFVILHFLWDSIRVTGLKLISLCCPNVYDMSHIVMNACGICSCRFKSFMHAGVCKTMKGP